jgi:hypothetical protein
MTLTGWQPLRMRAETGCSLRKITLEPSDFWAVSVLISFTGSRQCNPLQCRQKGADDDEQRYHATPGVTPSVDGPESVHVPTSAHPSHGDFLIAHKLLYDKGMKSEINSVLFAMPLDYPMFVELDVLGASHMVSLSGRQATVELPRLAKESDQHALLPPQSAVEQLSNRVELWGKVVPSRGGLLAEVHGVLFKVPCSVRVDWDVSTDQAGGEDIANLGQEIHAWLDSFITWIWGLTSQSLDKNHPDPKMIHRSSTNMVQVVTARDRSSHPAIVSSSDPIVVDFRGHPSSERAVNRDIAAIAATRAGSAPPIVIELLASARMFCRRGDRRRAIIDAGAVAEAALTRLSSRSAKKSKKWLTLGDLVSESKIVPADTKPNLVTPRNDAVHRNTAPSFDITNRAIEIVEELAALVEPDLIRADTLRHLNRPARRDLVIISSPSHPTDNNGS